MILFKEPLINYARARRRILLAGSALLAGSLLAFPAAACTLDNWNSHSGDIAADSPGNGFPRYTGICGARVNGQGWVQSDRPDGIERIVARFYVLNGLTTGKAVIYEGYSNSDGSGLLFTISLDSDGNVDFSDGNGSVTQQSNTKWTSVEIDYRQGAPDGLRLSVNGQSPSVAGAGNGSPVQSVRLGNLDGGGSGTLHFDAYESHRSTPVGRLLRGDASNSGTLGAADISAIIDEIQDGVFAPGQPDCTESGSVDDADIGCVVNLFLGLE